MPGGHTHVFFQMDPCYIVYFPESRALKRVRCVKFTNDFDGMIEMSDDSDPLLERQSQMPDAVVDDEIADENEDEARRYPQRKRTISDRDSYYL